QIFEWKHCNAFFRHDFAGHAGDGLPLQDVRCSQPGDDQRCSAQRAVGKPSARLLFRRINDSNAVVKLRFQRRWRLRALRWVSLQHALDKIDNCSRDSFQLVEWQDPAELLLANFFARATEWYFPC